MGNIEELDHNMEKNLTQQEEGISFYELDQKPFFVSGLPAYEECKEFNRIPRSHRDTIEKANPCLIELGSHTAGGQISFRSNTKRLIIRAKISNVHNMTNMTPIGQCGFDCYVGKSKEDMIFLGATAFDLKSTQYECSLIKPNAINILNKVNQRAEDECNEFLINFPLYCHVEKVEIGINKDAVVEPPSDYAKNGKLIFYGTSITQGGCASRPGMAYTNIISRRLNLEHLNFGFSGNGLGEYEIADLMAEVKDPLMYVLDYEANAGTNGRLVASLKGFVERLREKHKKVPIVILSRIPWVMDDLDPEAKELRGYLRNFQRDFVTQSREENDDAIYFVNGKELFPVQFQELTVDTVHPTDLGFSYMAENLIPTLKSILNI